MLVRFENQDDLENAMHALVKQDPRLKPILAQTGMPALRQREPGFEGLAHIVCGQQLSTASAAAIWARLSAAFDPFDHEAIRKARSDRLGFGVGLAMGPATVGRIGYENRFDYTAIGCVVNLAARLCASAADQEILIEEKVADAVTDQRLLGPLSRAGRGRPRPSRRSSSAACSRPGCACAGGSSSASLPPARRH